MMQAAGLVQTAGLTPPAPDATAAEPVAPAGVPDQTEHA